MKEEKSITTSNQPPLVPSDDSNEKFDGGPELEPATAERLANIVVGGTIGIGVGMAVGMALAFLKNGWGGGGEELLTFMGIGLMLCGTIGIIIGAFHKVSLPVSEEEMREAISRVNQDAAEFRKEKVA